MRTIRIGGRWRSWMGIGLASLLLAVPQALAAQERAVPSADGPAGLWIGGIGEPFGESPSWDSCRLELEASPEGFTGTFEVGGRSSSARGSLDGDVLSLRVTVRGLPRSVAATYSRDRLTGEIRLGSQAERFALRRMLRLSPGALMSFGGIYELEGGDCVSLLGHDGILALTDFDSGKRRIAFPIATDVFAYGPAQAVTDPIEGKIRFLRDEAGKITGFERTEDGLTTSARRRRGPEHEPFSFQSPDGLTLQGMLLRPAGPGPHPAMLWVHGSGREGRHGAGAWAHFVVSRGFAFVAVDKRGVGASEGTYELPDGSSDNAPHMIRRAGDVLAALRALKQTEGIEETVGLIGASQAGWIIPQVAESGEASFGITISGGATRLVYEGTFSALADENRATASSLSLEEALERTREATPAGYDFRPHFEKMTCPGLWLYGDRDRSNPTQLCIELLTDIREKSDKDFTFVRFPEGNHSLMVCRTGGGHENARLDRMVPGLADHITRWLDEKGFLPEGQ